MRGREERERERRTVSTRSRIKLDVDWFSGYTSAWTTYLFRFEVKNECMVLNIYDTMQYEVV